VVAFTLFGSLLSAVPALAQQSLPWSRQGQYLYRQYPDTYSNSGNFAPQATNVVPATTVENSRANYPAFLNQDKVRINVNAPANAKISFQGTMTNQTGMQRIFESPLLQPGFNYTYNVVATWTEDGREVSQSKVFPVRPGETVDITITRNAVNVNPRN